MYVFFNKKRSNVLLGWCMQGECTHDFFVVAISYF